MCRVCGSAFKITTSGGTRTHNPRLRRPVPYPLGHRGFPELHDIVMVTAWKLKTYFRLIFWKSLGDTRVWTRDLSICSRMLYHWAISPTEKIDFHWTFISVWPNLFSTCAHVLTWQQVSFSFKNAFLLIFTVKTLQKRICIVKIPKTRHRTMEKKQALTWNSISKICTAVIV